MKTADFVHKLLTADPADDAHFHQIIANLELVTTVQAIASRFGMSHSTIERWKSGESVPHTSLRPRIYRCLQNASKRM